MTTDPTNGKELTDRPFDRLDPLPAAVAAQNLKRRDRLTEE